MNKDAVLSVCGTFRYRLTRRWDYTSPVLVFVMLNPSTADAAVDDPTIRRCMSFARIANYGGIEVVNLYAYRCSKPEGLNLAGWPVGVDNDRHIEEACRDKIVYCAWGAHARRNTVRMWTVYQIIRRVALSVNALAITNDGMPRHPLYLSGSCKPFPYTLPFFVS